MKRYIFFFVSIFYTAIILAVLYINFDTVIGAFGDGPPYYGRTTNMDKWENPIPLLLLIDVITLFFVGASARRIYKYLK